MENLTVSLDIEQCEEIFRNIEEDFESMYEVYNHILSAAGEYTSSWEGDYMTLFVQRMEFFQAQLQKEAQDMDIAIHKMRGCLQKAKEIEELGI